VKVKPFNYRIGLKEDEPVGNQDPAPTQSSPAPRTTLLFPGKDRVSWSNEFKLVHFANCLSNRYNIA